MVGAKTILVVTIVDCNFDGHRSINQANDGGGDSDEVRISAVCCAGKSEATKLVKYDNSMSSLDGSHRLRHFYPATSVTNPPPTTSTGSCIICE